MIEARLKYTGGCRPEDAQEIEDSMDNLTFDEPVQLDFFQTCYYDKNDRKKCQLIKKTVKERATLLKTNPNLDLKFHFPCLLLNFELVSILCFSYYFFLSAYKMTN